MNGKRRLELHFDTDPRHLELQFNGGGRDKENALLRIHVTW